MKKNVMLVALSCILLPHIAVAMKKAVPAQYSQKQLDDALAQINDDDWARAVRLVEAGGNPSCYQKSCFWGNNPTPLSFIVAKKGTSQQLEILLNKRVPVTQTDDNGSSLLHAAARVGNVEMVLMLISRGLSVSEKNAAGAQAVHVAAESGKTDVIKLLVSQKASLEATDAQGAGVLHYAAKGGSEPVIKELLAANASIASVDRNGAGALHHAVENGHLHLVKPLLAAKATIDATDYKGAGVLHYATRTKNEAGAAALIRLLVAERVANNGGAHVAINRGDFEGKTPLHEAVILKKNTAALTLIEEGADTTIKDKKGKMPLQYALENPIAKPAAANECASSL